MADIDDGYEGDLGPLLADLEALRSALGDSYQDYREGTNPDDDPDDNWQQQQQQQTEEEEEDGTAAAPSTAPPPRRAKPAPLIERLAAVSSALEANRSLQDRLTRLITSVTRAQDQAVGIRDRVRASQRRRQLAASAPHALSTRKSSQDQQFTGVSWFWSQPGAPAPPPYLGYSEIKAVPEVLPLVFSRSKWQEDELNSLCEGVVQVVQERLLNKLLTDLESGPVAGGSAAPSTAGEDGGGGVFQGGISLEEFEARQAPIRALTASSPDVIAIAATLTLSEWATVAHRSAPGRAALECSLAWKNAAMPTINHEKFIEEEDKILLELVQQYGTKSWGQIASELHQPPPVPPSRNATTSNATTNTTTTTTVVKQRTPLACMSRHQQLLHTNRSTQEFTAADLERLIQIVNRIGVQWKRVAEEFGGPWDFEQLMHQWRRHAQRHEGGDGTTSSVVVPRRGKWLPEEDELLLTAVALYGKKWSHAAKLVPGRSDVQCRERYANCLDPEVNKDPWNEAEDEILRANIEKFTNAATGKTKWSAIAELIPGRTDYAVKKRWIALFSGQSRGGGGGGGGTGGAKKKAVQSDGAAANNGASGSGGGRVITAGIPSSTQPSSAPKKKEPAAVKKKPRRVAPVAPPPPPPPPEEPVISRTGRAIAKPSRFKE